MKYRIYALPFILLIGGLLAGCAGTGTTGAPPPTHAASPTDQETIRHAQAAYHRRDYATAFREAMPLATQGNAWAQFAVGLMYLMGDGVEKNPAEGIKWLRQSAAQGNDLAQLSLGNAYALGMGVAKDEAQAAVWFRKAADQGDAMAQYIVGRAYEHGIGVGKDLKQAKDWYRKAADQGDENAQQALWKLMTPSERAKWRPGKSNVESSK